MFSVATGERQISDDISAWKGKQSSARLPYSENVNYGMLMMGHCDIGE